MDSGAGAGVVEIVLGLARTSKQNLQHGDTEEHRVDQFFAMGIREICGLGAISNWH
jgi:hypothetical protein